MNKLTRNLVAFLVTFLVVQLWSMYIVGGFDYQTVTSKVVSCFIGIVLGAAVLIFIDENREIR